MSLPDSILEIETAEIDVSSNVNFTFDWGTIGIIIGCVVGLLVVIFAIAFFCGRGCCFCADNVCCKGRALENPRKARKAREQRELVQAVADGMVAAAETSRNQTFQDPDAFQTSARRSRYRPNSKAYTNVSYRIDESEGTTPSSGSQNQLIRQPRSLISNSTRIPGVSKNQPENPGEEYVMFRDTTLDRPMPNFHSQILPGLPYSGRDYV